MGSVAGQQIGGETFDAITSPDKIPFWRFSRKHGGEDRPSLSDATKKNTLPQHYRCRKKKKKSEAAGVQ